MQSNLKTLAVLLGSLLVTACVGGGDSAKSSLTGQSANSQNAAQQEIVYVNKASRNIKTAPKFIVLPGTIQTSSQEFTINGEQIAGMAEVELSKANFGIIERSALGPMLREVQLAVEMGDADKAKKLLQTGKLKTTRWFLKLDILKAEKQDDSGISIGIFGSKTSVWNFSMRYKLIDAQTTEVIDTDIINFTHESGGQSVNLGGIQAGKQSSIQLDSVVEKLVQKCINILDAKNPS